MSEQNESSNVTTNYAERPVRIHVKNNRWAPGSFPNTPEGEEVFTITQERFDSALAKFPDLVDRLSVFIDW